MVSDPVFPESRFVDAGATSQQVEAFRVTFTSSDVLVQRSLADFWSSQSISGLATVIANRFRATVEASPTPEAQETALEAPVTPATVEDDKIPGDDDETGLSEPDEG